MQEPKKQIVTREIIEKELLLKRNANYLTLLWLSIPFVAYFIYYFCVIAYQIDFNVAKSILKFVLLTFAGLVLAVFYLNSLLKFRNFKSYKITLEHLHHKSKVASFGIHVDFNIQYRLYFGSGLMCDMPGIKVFDISDTLAFNEAKETDKFYVVQSGKKVLAAFNARYFELE